MSMSIDPFISFGRCTASFITRSTLEEKIATVARSIFLGALIFTSRFYRFIPLATLLPASGVVFLTTFFFSVLLIGYLRLQQPQDC